MWEKEKPIKGDMGICMSCPPIHHELPLSQGVRIAVGFGDAYLTKDGTTVWRETSATEWDECMSYDAAEGMATADPDHDWRIHLISPLKESHYQRQGIGQWVLYEKGKGFA